jgi:hypothetical protein
MSAGGRMATETLKQKVSEAIRYIDETQRVPYVAEIFRELIQRGVSLRYHAYQLGNRANGNNVPAMRRELVVILDWLEHHPDA